MVLLNNVVRKDFVVPEIAVTIDGLNINIGAIDKLVHAKFLAANPKIIFFDTVFDPYIFQTAVRIVDYTGDEVDTDMQGTPKFYMISIFDNI